MGKTRKNSRARIRGGGDPLPKLDTGSITVPEGWSLCTSEPRKVGNTMETYDAICRKLCFKSFMDTGKGLGAMEFLSAFAPIAQGKMHHPEWKNSYNRVEIVFTTHDSKGITQLDLDLANEVNNLINTTFKDRMSAKDC